MSQTVELIEAIRALTEEVRKLNARAIGISDPGHPMWAMPNTGVRGCISMHCPNYRGWPERLPVAGDVK